MLLDRRRSGTADPARGHQLRRHALSKSFAFKNLDQGVHPWSDAVLFPRSVDVRPT
jgi:hypothetical protein